MPDPFQLSAQMNAAPSVQDFSALSAKMDALRSGGQPMQGTAQVDDGWGAVDQSLNIAPKMPVLPPVPSRNQELPPMYTSMGDSSPYQQHADNGKYHGANFALTDVISPGSAQQIFRSYMAKNNVSAEEARAHFEGLAAQAEAKHVYFQNQQRYREGRPPIDSFDRQKFLDARRRSQEITDRVMMPQQQSADPYVPMWRRTEELIGTPQERRARGWR
jgi:hypothetical protein